MSSQPSSSGQAISVIKPDELLTEVQFVEPKSGRDYESGTSNSIRHKMKLGHRRIDKQGEVSYKRVPTEDLIHAVQLGIANSIGSLANKDRRDILVQDFQVIENIVFPSEGSHLTPPHPYDDFRFKTYAPTAFRYFRELFNIKPADFLHSICLVPLKELSNPGASGSIFYVSADDKFIIKTVQHKEAEFLRTLLPGYYLNLHQNPRTILPKFFGLFCYQSSGKNIRLLVMNNLLPQSITMHAKFDLKGSTYKRYASKSERAKQNPTLKDLDFNEDYKSGIVLDAPIYDVLMDIIKRDCLVLESFKIMDYSLLIGVHNIDLELFFAQSEAHGDQETNPEEVAQRCEAWKSLQLDFSTSRSPYEEGGVPAHNAKGERLLIFLGIIDILQSYRLFKKLEHTWKSVLHDGDSISVTNPTFYAARFQSYIRDKVFFRAPTMKQTPARQQTRTRSAGDNQQQQQPYQSNSQSHVEQLDAGGGGAIVALAAQRMEFEPTMIGQRNTQERRSYYNKNSAHLPEIEKKKRIERLFELSGGELTQQQPQFSAGPIVTNNSTHTDV